MTRLTATITDPSAGKAKKAPAIPGLFYAADYSGAGNRAIAGWVRLPR